MACLVITATNADVLFIGPKGTYVFIRISDKKIYLKTSSKNVSHFVTASMSQSEPFELHGIMW